MLKVMRDHGHIMALAQHLEQIDTIRLSTTKAAAKAINQECYPQAFRHVDGSRVGLNIELKSGIAALSARSRPVEAHKNHLKYLPAPAR